MRGGSYTLEESSKRAVLVLEDGTLIKGVGFGAVKKVTGEVVFNTGMVGYTEALTDPSYKGQILMQTYPLIGNYGVCSKHFESDGPKVEGYIIRELCRQPSHHTSEKRLDEWLEEEGIPGIERVDTRYLTKKIRIQGVMRGILQVYEAGDEPDFQELLEESKRIPDPYERDLVGEVAVKEPYRMDCGGKIDVVLIDCGVKRSIVRSLLNEGLNVTVVPPTYDADRILDYEPAGIVVSNGPGDPKRCGAIVKTISSLIETNLPIFGICLGNQLISLALGGDTYKLKFGHRGQNHPCMDLKTKRCFITSQNHGFAVSEASLKDTGLEVTMINVNDRTVEGIRHKKKPIFAVQFHPEASPGPNDTYFLFREFKREVEKALGRV